MASAKNNQNLPPGLRLAARALAPFTRVAANILNEGLNYTPVGALRAAWAISPSWARASWGRRPGYTAGDKAGPERGAIRQGGAGAGGGGAGALESGAGLEAANPAFTLYGGGPGNADDKARWRAMGGIPYAFQDRALLQLRAHADGGFPGGGGNYLDHLRDAKLYRRPGAERVAEDAPLTAATALLGAGKVVFEQPMMQGLADTAGLLDDRNAEAAAKRLYKLVSGSASSVVIPNWLRQRTSSRTEVNTDTICGGCCSHRCRLRGGRDCRR